MAREIVFCKAHGIDDLFDRDIAQNCNGRVNDPLYRQAVMLVNARADYQY